MCSYTFCNLTHLVPFDNVFQFGLQFRVNVWMQIDIRPGEAIVLEDKQTGQMNTWWPEGTISV